MGADPCSVGELGAAVALTHRHDQMPPVSLPGSVRCRRLVVRRREQGRGGTRTLLPTAKRPQPNELAVTKPSCSRPQSSTERSVRHRTNATGKRAQRPRSRFVTWTSQTIVGSTRRHGDTASRCHRDRIAASPGRAAASRSAIGPPASASTGTGHGEVVQDSVCMLEPEHQSWVDGIAG